MAMVVRTNMNSMNANRNLSINNSQVAKSIQKLASGYAINNAADDASGLAVTEKMRAQITGLDQGTENALDGVCLIQTAEGAMDEIHNMLNRMTELATKAANGTIQDEIDREAIQAEVDVLVDEIDRIAQATNYNGIPLLDGSLAGIGGIGGTIVDGNIVTETVDGITFKKVTVTENSAGYVIDVNFNALTGSDLIGGTMTIDGGFVVQFKEATITDGNGDLITGFVDASGNYVGEFFSATDSPVVMYIDPNAKAKNAVSHFHLSINNRSDGVTNGEYCFEHNGYRVENDGYTFLYDGYYLNPMSVEFDLPNNTFNGVNTSVNDGSTSILYGQGLILHVADENEIYNKIQVIIDPMTGEALEIKPLDVSTQEAAGLAIDKIKNAINYVSENRANLGALQNRLERTVNNNNNTSENMSSAVSTIKDTDMAAEMMEYTKMNVLVQSAQSMLAQSNQAPQSILELLG